MKRKNNIWGFAGLMAVSLLGSLLHFLYGWTDSAAVALFSAVNESTWEHMKLLFFPLLLFAVVQSFYFKEQRSFWCVKLKSALLGLLLIPIIFYTLRGVFGGTPDFVNILIFFISAAAAFIYEARQFNNDSTFCKRPLIAFILLVLIALIFFVFTFIAPEIPLFKDPISGLYGI